MMVTLIWIKLSTDSSLIFLSVWPNLNQITLENKSGLQEKAKQGRLITTHAPFGYDYHNGTFIINQNESPTVKAVFNYYIKGHGYKKLHSY